MARMRRRFADRGEVAKANADRFGRERSGFAGRERSGIAGDASQMGRDLTSGIMNPNLRPAVGNTAGRGRGTYTKTPMGSYEFSPVGITRRPTLPPEMYEHMVGQNKNWLSKIGGALKNEFGGSAMAGELYDWQDVKGQEKFSADELRELGLSGSPEGALADENLVSGGAARTRAGVPGGAAQDARTMAKDISSAIPEGNFMDPLGYKTNYPEDYRTNADILRFDPRYARTEQTIGPGGQGFYPPNTNKPWYQFWNRGGIASLIR